MINKNSAVLILTHGRADNVKTYRTLKENGYTGKIYCVIDDMDGQQDKYIENFGKDNVIIFNKMLWAERTDTMDMGDDMRAVVFARNACWTIAKELGLEYFIVLDDDYTGFGGRYEYRKGKLKQVPFHDLDKVFDAFLDFLDDSGALTVCMAQGGDFIGGASSNMWKNQLSRKAMNVWFCRTDRPFEFYGRINEDTNFYVSNNIRGNLCFTVATAECQQMITQKNKGGLTDIYLNLGTYIKSFYSVMIAPSCVKVAPMGVNDRRIHHRVSWGNCSPKILNERYKKSK